MANNSFFLRDNSLKPFLFFVLGATITCLYFWLSSRYPDLNTKASLGPSAPISSLAFTPIMEVSEGDGFWYRVWAETINWAHTNKKGMSFAFVIGAFFLSLIPLFKRPRTGNGPLDSLLGFLSGAPLGVCVNCAAPISKSMMAAGASVQYALSVLITSPTMNVVVLMMAFTFFPAFLVGLKIILTMIFALVLVPIGCRYFFQKDVKFVHEHLEETQHIHHEDCKNIPTDWLGSFLWGLKTYAKNFWYLLKVALPLMVLAGFLGSLLSIAIPWDQIQLIDGSYDKSLMLLFFMFAISVFGAFMPCPITFDIVLASTLLMAGVPLHYVAVFMFTLGTFSIYAFFIVWQSVSARAAIYMYMCTVLLGVLIGLLTMQISNVTQTSIAHEIELAEEVVKTEKQQDQRPVTTEEQSENIDEDAFDPIIDRKDMAFTYGDIAKDIKAISAQELEDINASEDLKISVVDFTGAENQGAGFRFDIGDVYGIKQPYEVSYLSYIPEALPYGTMGIASGDVHNDGWPDLLLAGDTEANPNLILYTNVNGQKFLRQQLPSFGRDNAAIVVAMFDLNGDGWSDIFLTTLKGEAHILYNDQGNFSEENAAKISKSDGIPLSVSFGDIEGDGDIDIFLGHWSAGPNFINRPESRNVVLISDGAGNYTSKDLPGITGETLTSLFDDFDGDGILDLYVGNDHDMASNSDQIFKGQKDGNFVPYNTENLNGFVGASSSMSVDRGDVDNDLLPDYYIAQIAYSGHFARAMKQISDRQIHIDDYCAEYSKQSGQDMNACTKNIDLKKALARIAFLNADSCYTLTNQKQKTKCFIHYQTYLNFCRPGVVAFNVNVENKASRHYKEFCDKILQPSEHIDLGNEPGHVKLSNYSRSNVFLHQQKSQDVDKPEFSEEAMTRKIGYGAWSWNSRFADLDNDGWQDIYVSNGFPFSVTTPMNLFYRNKGNGEFEEVSKEYALNSYSPTSAYSIIDFNLDGYQDIISAPTDGPVEVFTSKGGGNAIRFKLNDKSSKNSQGLGAIITIAYKNADGAAGQQMQIIKSSGGYRSFNEPVAHFGLGDVQNIDQVTIKWPDGNIDEISSNFQSDQLYIIERN